MVGRKNATRVNIQKNVVELTQLHQGIKALLAVEKARTEEKLNKNVRLRPSIERRVKKLFRSKSPTAEPIV
jgi:LytS/YehU family sensor histidine kinase